MELDFESGVSVKKICCLNKLQFPKEMFGNIFHWVNQKDHYSLRVNRGLALSRGVVLS
jgi:hypothetical protein